MYPDAFTPESLHICNEVISGFTAIKLKHRRHSKASFEGYLPQIISIWNTKKIEQREKNKVSGYLFNPFTFIDIGETTHSRLLGDLLDPKGSHDQGSLFLEAFLESITVPEPQTGRWTITIEAGRVDICLRRSSPASVILIENKSNWAVDQPNQLYRYWYENIYKSYPKLDYSIGKTKKSFQIIYLSPASEKQPELHSLQCPSNLDGLGLPKTLSDGGVTVKICSFSDLIVPWLKESEKFLPQTNSRLINHLQFYSELWN